jgi:hypothetical protein
MSNCLVFAISHYMAHGGRLYMEWWGRNWLPHFAVVRHGITYDYGKRYDTGNMFWFEGKIRECKRERTPKIWVLLAIRTQPLP